jgi:hypothetical protein
MEGRPEGQGKYRVWLQDGRDLESVGIKPDLQYEGEFKNGTFNGKGVPTERVESVSHSKNPLFALFGLYRRVYIKVTTKTGEFRDGKFVRGTSGTTKTTQGELPPRPQLPVEPPIDNAELRAS